jgi:dynein light chain roadblock-type
MSSTENPKALPGNKDAQSVSAALTSSLESKDPLKIEETLNRLQRFKGVLGVLIVNSDGQVVKSSFDNVQTIQYTGMMIHLSNMAKSTVRDLDPDNDLRIFRIKTKKHEIMVAPGKYFFKKSKKLFNRYSAES